MYVVTLYLNVEKEVLFHIYWGIFFKKKYPPDSTFKFDSFKDVKISDYKTVSVAQSKHFEMILKKMRLQNLSKMLIFLKLKRLRNVGYCV